MEDAKQGVAAQSFAEVVVPDAYLDVDFVSRYLGFAVDDVRVRLLGGKKIATLIPAIDLFVQHAGDPVPSAVCATASKTLLERDIF